MSAARKTGVGHCEDAVVFTHAPVLIETEYICVFLQVNMARPVWWDTHSLQEDSHRQPLLREGKRKGLVGQQRVWDHVYIYLYTAYI